MLPIPSATKAKGRQQEANRIYAYPLPIIFSPPDPPNSWYAHVGLFPFRQTQIKNPRCEGVYDPNTRSVWVTNSEHSMILWQRGFFGKGCLSRSEPSLVVRRIHEQQERAKNAMTAEEVTAKRRAERTQYKRDRAQAFAAAVADAEAAFAAGDASVKIAPLTREAVAAFASRASDRVDVDGPGEPSTNSYSDIPTTSESPMAEEDDPLENFPRNLEYLQLTLQEAFFLLWALDCLCVLDSSAQIMSLSNVWTSFQSVYNISTHSLASATPRFDNPFLVNYAVYHHYRSLGWVVRSGIKFGADYLLYKRGPVFHHAEFVLIVCPVYENTEDQRDSPFDLANTTPFSWAWLSTINRVNTQVQKVIDLVTGIRYHPINPASLAESNFLARLSCIFLGQRSCITTFRTRKNAWVGFKIQKYRDVIE